MHGMLEMRYADNFHWKPTPKSLISKSRSPASISSFSFYLLLLLLSPLSPFISSFSLYPASYPQFPSSSVIRNAHSSAQQELVSRLPQNSNTNNGTDKSRYQSNRTYRRRNIAHSDDVAVGRKSIFPNNAYFRLGWLW